MSEALFALAGALVGVLGTLGTEFMRARRDDRQQRNDAVQRVAADFVSLISQAVELSFYISGNPADVDLSGKALDINMAMRAQYERLRLVSRRRETQEAARHVIRYAWGTLRMATGQPLRSDERDREPHGMVADWMVTFCIEVRKETHVPDAENVYREPDDWLGLGKITNHLSSSEGN